MRSRLKDELQNLVNSANSGSNKPKKEDIDASEDEDVEEPFKIPTLETQSQIFEQLQTLEDQIEHDYLTKRNLFNSQEDHMPLKTTLDDILVNGKKSEESPADEDLSKEQRQNIFVEVEKLLGELQNKLIFSKYQGVSLGPKLINQVKEDIDAPKEAKPALKKYKKDKEKTIEKIKIKAQPGKSDLMVMKNIEFYPQTLSKVEHDIKIEVYEFSQSPNC